MKSSLCEGDKLEKQGGLRNQIVLAFLCVVWYNKLSGIQGDIKMLMFKKKKIQVYLNNVGDPKTAFDLLLCDYLNGSIKKDFESIGFEKISIHIDWLDNYKCIGIQCPVRLRG